MIKDESSLSPERDLSLINTAETSVLSSFENSLFPSVISVIKPSFSNQLSISFSLSSLTSFTALASFPKREVDLKRWDSTNIETFSEMLCPVPSDCSKASFE